MMAEHLSRGLRAAARGINEAVQLQLVQEDADPDNPDDNGRTPLWWVSFTPNERAVNLLQARQSVNPNSV